MSTNFLRYEQGMFKKVDFLRKNATLVPLKISSQILGLNMLYRADIPGTAPTIYIRESINKKLEELVKILGPCYQIAIYDGLRSDRTQDLLTKEYQRKIAEYQDSDDLELVDRTQELNPNASGGAIDLSLYYKNEPLDMGTEYDDLSLLAQADFFEKEFKAEFTEEFGISQTRWETIRRNRMFLFNSMTKIGFINDSTKWWHFDLGSTNWANQLGITWHYDSAASQLEAAHTDEAQRNRP